jgi:hypothetical protein
MALMMFHRRKGIAIAGIGEQIEVDHTQAVMNGLKDKIGANEPGSAGD